MKRIVTVLFLILSFTSAYSQDQESRNVLRGGAALIMKGHKNYKGSNTFFTGSQFQMEYSRKFSSYFSLDASLLRADINYSYLNGEDKEDPRFKNATSYGVSIKGIFTPIKAIKWLKIGAGGFAEYAIEFKSMQNYEYSLYRRRYMFYGINIPLRFYILDSKKFDLYAYYEYTARIDGSNYSKSSYYFLHDAFGVMFGVKF